MSHTPTPASNLGDSLPSPSLIRLPERGLEDVMQSGETSIERSEAIDKGNEDSARTWIEGSRYTLPPWSQSPLRRTEHIAHLPTPQSPSNLGAYVDSAAYGTDSPVRSSSRNLRTPASVSMNRSPAAEFVDTPGSLITPESSPLVIRQTKPSAMLCGVTSPPSTPPRYSHPVYVVEGYAHSKSKQAVPKTPSPHSMNTPTHSGLSSPFIDKSERHTPNKAPTPPSPDSPFAPLPQDGDVFMSSNSPQPLPAPIPQRAAGGEITRLRLQMAAEQVALLQETESRRPEYLRRQKRPLSDLDDNIGAGDEDNSVSTIGVTDSPVKGRRVALFQETSEESFEQSLLAGGYPVYGRSPGYAEPTTPQAGALSQRAVDWIQQSTPGQQPSPQLASSKEDPHHPPTEQETRKRRRLEAFKDHTVTLSNKRLYAVEVEGHGRVLIDQLPEDIPVQQAETPTKKRNARRKRGGVPDSPSRKRAQVTENMEEVEPGRPDWLDQVFPWSMRVHEREDLAHKEEEQKLKWIERYLERESDEDEEQDQSLGLPASDIEDSPPRRGRGKMVPLPVDPGAPRTPSTRGRKYHPSDPADARAALLSKRSVRAFAFRRQKEEEEVVCVCRGKDDGRELVQCDDCKQWFHLECIGIADISELGREEDPWYCSNCLGIPATQSSPPTFVPTDERPSARGKRDLLFFQAVAQESPPGISLSTPRVPKTPVRYRDLTHQLSSRSSWDDSSSQAGPQTPSTGPGAPRIYHTPAPQLSFDEAFDPSSTPSRGMQFSGPFATPKPTALWPARNFPVQTPSRPAKKPAAPWAFDYRDDSSPHHGVFDDSPARHSPPRPDKGLFARRVQESPLAARSTSLLPLGRPHSPKSARPVIDRSQSRSALS